MSLEEIVKKDYVEGDQTLCFQTTPAYKIILLSVLSGGFYNLILGYSWWKKLKQNFGHKVSPFWRVFWFPLFNFSLFPILNKYMKNFNVDCDASAILYFIIGIMINLMNRATIKISGVNWFAEIAILVLSILSVLILVDIQNKINLVNGQNFPNAPKNNWNLANTIWTIILSITSIFYFLSLVIKSIMPAAI